ncbi:hypothetical protein CLV72_1011333 [Allonocardiopsis opalescens]|uniref:Uncharacterized protein n=1 Tax=Allonocardiopsis opalescens TaxID=1144618 RepID=A0A2T0QFR8_9ACTN|nr:hypothetical protein CLV72_1011333 [Allonocardiopsis opalescens]
MLSRGGGPDGPLAATTHALHLPDGSRVGWSEVEHARWTEDGLELTATTGERRLLKVTDRGLLPETVHERVVATIVVSRHVPLRGELGVRLICRRTPGTDEMNWYTGYDDGLDPDDPQTRAEAADALRHLRLQMGV